MTDQVYKTDALIAQDIDAYLESHQNKSLLRFITCGSVDDGKSTLIGRLLYDSKMIFEDQLTCCQAQHCTIPYQVPYQHMQYVHHQNQYQLFANIHFLLQIVTKYIQT